jgi:nicotinamidase-related amidase
VHLCVDMQRLFSTEGPWPAPWMDRVLPVVASLVAHCPARTAFTRFIPPREPEDMPGTWQRYYRKWRQVTRDRLDPAMLDLVPALAPFAPPAAVLDKPTYSAFASPALPAFLRDKGVDGLIVSGTETDSCVLATVLGAIDHGLRVWLVTDAVCSSSDEGHDALIDLYHRRFSEQLETVSAAAVLDAWKV